MKRNKAIILVSGGLDSATCLAVALDQGFDCYALSFDYGQKANSEIDAARRAVAATKSGTRPESSTESKVVEHKIISLNIGQLGGSALTDKDIAVPESISEGIPVTYVPARNTVFLSYALAWAEVVGASAIFIGVNALDYSGYPDCRPEFIAAFQALANLATKTALEGNPLRIETPLIDLSKAEIIKKGSALGVDYAITVSCYQADENGKACGVCDSCRFRSKGFADAGLADPTHYR